MDKRVRHRTDQFCNMIRDAVLVLQLQPGTTRYQGGRGKKVRKKTNNSWNCGGETIVQKNQGNHRLPRFSRSEQLLNTPLIRVEGPQCSLLAAAGTDAGQGGRRWDPAAKDAGRGRWRSIAAGLLVHRRIPSGRDAVAHQVGCRCRR